MRAEQPWRGAYVKYINNDDWRSRAYDYPELFGNRIHKVIDTRSDCCNVYLILDGIKGAYNSKMFRRTPPTPL